MVGFLTGQGYSSKEIARILHDGTIAATVRGMWRRWGLSLMPPEGQKRTFVTPIQLGRREREKLALRAQRRGITSEEYLRRILSCAIKDDLYSAIVGSNFDKPKR